ncbi:diaminopimelate epimerase [candidate division KSB1 bacterium 4484_87]|nr:MAG: diaminopimelate epimerase [candidate division KSB1 bacterium 4484_87]
MKKLKFSKLSATGNDFILFDNQDEILTGNEHDFFQKICQRRISVGADGVLLLEKSKKHHFSMRYFNSDGSLGEMCGNGARASAYFAQKYGVAPKEMTFDVLGVIYKASVQGNFVQLTMPPPVEIREYPGALEENEFREGGYLNVGVPHYVIFVSDIDAIDVERTGKKYRYHEAFQPWGTNVNFVQVIENDKILIRTYERGVEEETLACGTGTISAAILAVKQQGCKLPLKVQARGGLLEVDFDESISEIKLAGEAKEIYSGELIDG